jgi:group I intron endonuclease
MAVDPIANIAAASGVYRISCTANRKVYIGSALNVRKRLGGHRARLKAGAHINAHLQGAWNKYGSEAFTYTLLEETRPEFLIALEQSYIDIYDAANRERGFNIRSRAESNVGLPLSASARAKLSERLRGRPVSAETRAKIGAKHKGKTISIEARAKMAAAKLGKPLSEAHKRQLSILVRSRGADYHRKLSASKIGNTNSLGRKHPPEVIAKISAASIAMWARRRG